MTTDIITPAEIEQAMQRGRTLRSQAFMSSLTQLYRSLFVKTDERDRSRRQYEDNCAAPA